jgi:hypothetical protein
MKFSTVTGTVDDIGAAPFALADSSNLEARTPEIMCAALSGLPPLPEANEGVTIRDAVRSRRRITSDWVDAARGPRRPLAGGGDHACC